MKHNCHVNSCLHGSLLHKDNYYWHVVMAYPQDPKLFIYAYILDLDFFLHLEVIFKRFVRPPP